MLTRLITAALAAAVVAGLTVSVAQQFTTTPLIIEAEKYEGGGQAAVAGSAQVALHLAGGMMTDVPPILLVDGSGGHDEWAPEDGLERTLYTSVAALGTYFGFALALLGAMILAGSPIEARNGLMWGAAAFAVTGLAPALGLPPELPGAATAELAARKYWWVGTAIVTAAGLFLVLRVSTRRAITLGVVLIAVPHLIGAPHLQELTSNVPSELSGQFASASLVVHALGWAITGAVAGYVWERLSAHEGLTVSA